MLVAFCAAVTEHPKIDKAQKRHDVYRLLFTRDIYITHEFSQLGLVI